MYTEIIYSKLIQLIFLCLLIVPIKIIPRKVTLSTLGQPHVPGPDYVNQVGRIDKGNSHICGSRITVQGSRSRTAS